MNVHRRRIEEEPTTKCDGPPRQSVRDGPPKNPGPGELAKTGGSEGTGLRMERTFETGESCVLVLKRVGSGFRLVDTQNSPHSLLPRAIYSMVPRIVACQVTNRDYLLLSKPRAKTGYLAKHWVCARSRLVRAIATVNDPDTFFFIVAFNCLGLTFSWKGEKFTGSGSRKRIFEGSVQKAVRAVDTKSLIDTKKTQKIIGRLKR